MKPTNFLKYFVLIFFIPCMVFAGGPDFNSFYSSKIYSLNGLNFAGTHGIGSVFSNPGSLSYLNKGLELSIIDNIHANEYNRSDAGSFRSYNEDNIDISGGIFWNFSDKFSFSLGYFPYSNFNVDWPYLLQRSNDSSSVTLAFNFFNRIKINSITPTISAKFDNISLGISANIYRVNQDLSFPQSNDQWDSLGFAAYQFEYALDAWAFGGTLGIMYDLNDDVRLGVKVNNGFSVDLKGDAKSNMFADLDSAAATVPVATTFEIPWSFGGGVEYKFSGNININLDFLYSLWGSTQEKLSYNFENSVWQSRLNNNRDSVTGLSAGAFNLDFQNTIDLGIGIEIKSNQGLSYLFGYRYSQSPNTAASYNMLFPGVDLHRFSIGVSYKDDNLNIDAGIAYTLGFSKNIDKTSNNFSYGTYSSRGYVPGLSIRYNL